MVANPSLRKAAALALTLALGCSGADGGPFGDAASSSGSSSQVCVAGEQVACACPSGVPGAQACSHDGSGYDACDCSGNGSPTAATGSSGGVTSGGGDGGSASTGSGQGAHAASTSSTGADGGGGASPATTGVGGDGGAPSSSTGAAGGEGGMAPSATSGGGDGTGGGAGGGIVGPTLDSGMMVVGTDGLPDYARRIAVDPDGRLLLAGFTGFSQTRDILVMRLLASGAPDPSFGLGGTVTIDVGPSGDLAEALLVRPDGKILVGGFNESGTDTALVLLDESGALDPAFGSGGIAGNPVVDDDGIMDMSLLPDGSVLSAGRAYDAGYEMMLARFDPAGALDVDFSADGVTTLVVEDRDWAMSVAVDSAGRYVVLGFSQAGNLVFARYNPDGSLDGSFGQAGTSIVDLGGFEIPRGMVLDDQDRMICAFERFASEAFGIARVDSNGALDPTFGASGSVILPGPGKAFSVVLDDAGRALVVGSVGDGDAEDLAVARFLDDGTLDPGFGEDGVAVLPFDFISVGDDIAIEPAGTIVVVGHVNPGDQGNMDIAIARLLADGSLASAP